jgi:hypothetical protein
MLDRIQETPGIALDGEAYSSQYDDEMERVTGAIWKLERAQAFAEDDDDPAWQAFLAGKWERSLAVFESERAVRVTEAAGYARQGSEFRRVRIVEHPVSAYLQWELHALKISDESGLLVRVLDASKVRDLEYDQQLPELVIVGDQVVFEVCYDERWKWCGARRIDDRKVIEQAAAEMARLWVMAEPLAVYFAREIAPLPVPTA